MREEGKKEGSEGEKERGREGGRDRQRDNSKDMQNAVQRTSLRHNKTLTSISFHFLIMRMNTAHTELQQATCINLIINIEV